MNLNALRMKHLVIALTSLILLGVLIFGATYSYAYWQNTRRAFDVQLPSRGDSKPVYLFSIYGNEKEGGLLEQPMAAVAGPGGRVYVSDSGNHRIQVFYPSGKFAYSFGKQGKKAGMLDFPYGLAFVGDSLWVADPGNGTIQAFDRIGIYRKTILPAKAKFKPGNLLAANGRVYVSDLAGHQVLELNEEGKILKKIRDKEIPLFFPHGLAIDAQKRLVVADAGNFRLQVMSPAGRVKAVINGEKQGGEPFSLVRGVAVDNLGRIFAADTMAHKLRVFDGQGKELFALDGTKGLEERLRFPVGISIDQEGLIYVTEWGKNTVQVWGYLQDWK